MTRFIGIGEVFTVPREENIAAMEGGEGEVMGITAVFHGHDFVFQVNLHDHIDLVRIEKTGKIIDQFQHVLPFRLIGSFLKLRNDDRRCDKCVAPLRQFPPFSRPFPARLQLYPCPGFKIETRNAGLDVNEAIHDAERSICIKLGVCEVRCKLEG